MNKKGVELPINTIIVLILALIFMVVVILIIQSTTSVKIFPAIIDSLKSAFGFLNQSKQGLPLP